MIPSHFPFPRKECIRDPLFTPGKVSPEREGGARDLIRKSGEAFGFSFFVVAELDVPCLSLIEGSLRGKQGKGERGAFLLFFYDDTQTAALFFFYRREAFFLHPQ